MFEAQFIDGVILVQPKRFGDERGYFCETYHLDRFDAAGVRGPFVQDNHSLSGARGVIRGLHFQVPPHAQAKLVRCTRGAIYDVAVDIRTGSSTYGNYVGAMLSAENGFQLYIPVGFAHGFCTLTEECEVQYKVTDYYSPECDQGLAWNDPEIGIDWPLDGITPQLSDKDSRQPLLSGFQSPF